MIAPVLAALLATSSPIAIARHDAPLVLGMLPFPSGMMLNSGTAPLSPATFAGDNDTSITLSNGNLTATKDATTGSAYVFGSEGKESGKWRFQVTVDVLSTQEMSIGLTGGLFILTDRTQYLGFGNSIGINSNTAGVIYNAVTSYAATFVVGDVIDVYCDIDNNKVWFAKNGAVLNGSPGAGTGGTTVSAMKKAWYPTLWLDGANCKATINYGVTAFAFSGVAGFNAWLPTTPPVSFAQFRSALMYIRSLGFFSHGLAEFELMASSGGANVLSGATVTSSATLTGGALANLVDASTSTYATVGNTGVQNQLPAYFGFELAANAARNVAFAAVRGRDGGGGAQTQAPTLFDLWLSTGTIAAGNWYRSRNAMGVTLSAYAATTPGERKEFAVS